MMGVVTGSNEGLDAERVAIAERACALGGGSLPLLGFGPGACYVTARAYLDGLGGKTVDRGRALGLLEQGCEQELSIGPSKAGASCFYAARLLRDQPLFGEEVEGRKPIDEARATAFLERGCRNSQRDSCNALKKPLPP